MEIAVIVLFVVAIVLVNFVLTRIQRRKRAGSGGPVPGAATPSGPLPADRERRGPAGTELAPEAAPAGTRGGAKRGGPRTSPEAARAAAALLTAEQHQQIYAAIAQGQPLKAVKLYARFAGCGVRAAGSAVENLATHPQPYARPASGDAAGPAPTAGHRTAGNSTAGNPAADAAPSVPAPGAPKKADESTSAGPAADGLQEQDISDWAQKLRPEDFLKP